MTQMSFQYLALDRSGSKTRGHVTALTPADAYRRLAATGLTPLSVKMARESAGRRWFARKVKAADISRFTYQLSVLLEARIPVVECFRSIAEQEQNDRLRKISFDVAARVQGGAPITVALEAHRAVFGGVYVETVRAAEKSGNLVSVLAHLAEAVEEQEEMRRTLKGALMYPITVATALLLATLFLLVFVVPRFAKMFAQRGVELPLLTRVLMNAGESLRTYWWAYALGATLVVFGLRTMWHSPQGRARLDRYLNRVPLLGRMLTGLAVSRFASVFGLSLSSGLGLIECLDMAGRASGRPLLMEDVNKMINQVRQGGRLSGVLRSCAYLPGFVKQLMSAGEESAELSKMCRIISRQYGRELKHLCKNAATIMEPLLIAGLTGVVLLVALAIFLPMWNMIALVG